MNALSVGEIEIDDVSDTLAPKFAHTFKSLLSVMEARETKLRIKEAKGTSKSSNQSVSTESNAPQPIDSSTLHVEPRTPDEPTHPSNPKWSGSSSASQDEEATKKLLSLLLSETMTILGADFRKIKWQRSGLRVELAQTY